MTLVAAQCGDKMSIRVSLDFASEKTFIYLTHPHAPALQLFRSSQAMLFSISWSITLTIICCSNALSIETSLCFVAFTLGHTSFFSALLLFVRNVLHRAVRVRWDSINTFVKYSSASNDYLIRLPNRTLLEQRELKCECFESVRIWRHFGYQCVHALHCLHYWWRGHFERWFERAVLLSALLLSFAGSSSQAMLKYVHLLMHF